MLACLSWAQLSPVRRSSWPEYFNVLGPMSPSGVVAFFTGSRSFLDPPRIHGFLPRASPG